MMELAVMIAVLVLLVSVLFVAATAWQRGTDRARCILNIRQMQMSVRAYSRAHELEPGTDLSAKDPPLTLLAELVGPGDFVPELPRCPGGGMYFFGGDVIPESGQLYMTCSLGTSEGHQPDSSVSW